VGEEKKIVSSDNYWWVAIFCLFAVGFISLGVFYYHQEAQNIQEEKYQDLSTIAKLKAVSLQEWRRNKLADVRWVSANCQEIRGIASLLQDPMNPNTKAELQGKLKIYRKEKVYEEAHFLDTKGNILLSDNPNPATVDQATIKAIEGVLKDHKEVLSDFFRTPKGSIYLDALAPILNNRGQPIAILVLRSNAADFLYPFIQVWPTPSRTAETLLVCRDGNSVLFLNELRHRSNTALTLRFPLSDTHLPGVQAVLGHYGEFRGKDYRGVDVLAVTQPVLESPWSVVAKEDAKEILAEVRYRGRVVVLIVFFLIMISAGLMFNVIRKRQEVDRQRAEDALRQHSLDLEQLNETLEQRVLERTAELEKASDSLRHLSSRLLLAEEDERKRIALEVHDALGSSLSAIKFKMENIIQRIHNMPIGQIIEDLENLFPVIKGTIDDVRRIQADLRPPLLDDLGILSTFSWYCRRFEAIFSDIKVEQMVTIREEEVPEPLKIILFRITQEALNNIAKHAKANLVELGLRKIDGSLELCIRDNGEGFDPLSLFSGENSIKGLGITSMNERAKLSGGSFSLDSIKGSGTVIRVIWPL
jgi:signal transduction histidine kinase